MRPDPYKREKSRKYWAKQKAKGKIGEKAIAISSEGSVPPRWIKNLPSNADRYFENTNENFAPFNGEGDYDICDLENLNELFESVAINPGPSSPPYGQESTNNTCCDSYNELMALDIDSLSRRLPASIKENPPASLYADLPSWFDLREYQGTSLGQSRNPDSDLNSKKKTLGIPTIKKGKSVTSGSFTKSQTIASAENPIDVKTKSACSKDNWLDDLIKRT